MPVDRDQLLRAMAAFESCETPPLSKEVRWAALAGLGSKYLAVGSPASLALIDCGPAAAWIVACHELLFGDGVDIKLSGDNLAPPSSTAVRCEREQAFASDIVCMPCTVDFDLAWIAEATHLNLCWQPPGPSAGALILFESSSVTVESEHPPPLARRQSSLDEVITGHVSGRMADELTVLLHD